jgi:Domain of unknown function (DUF4287)
MNDCDVTPGGGPLGTRAQRVFSKSIPKSDKEQFRRNPEGHVTYKAYIDNVKAKTGKDPEYYRQEAKKKGLITHGELLAWLKSDCGLGHGHANAIILYIKNPELAKKKILEDTKTGKAEE